MRISFIEGAEYIRRADGTTTAGVEDHSRETFPVGHWIRFYIAAEDVKEATARLEGEQTPRPLDSFDDALDVLKLCIDALDGDGSTGTMPDVSPADAAIWVLTALHEAGYRFIRVQS